MGLCVSKTALFIPHVDSENVLTQAEVLNPSKETRKGAKILEKVLKANISKAEFKRYKEGNFVQLAD